MTEKRTAPTPSPGREPEAKTRGSIPHYTPNGRLLGAMAKARRDWERVKDSDMLDPSDALILRGAVQALTVLWEASEAGSLISLEAIHRWKLIVAEIAAPIIRAQEACSVVGAGGGE